MQVNINEKILSIPPYISTNWQNVEAVHLDVETQEKILVITLKSGSKIQIPHLTDGIIEEVFAFHSKVIQENDDKEPSQPSIATENTSFAKNPFAGMENLMGFSFPLRLGGNLEGLGAAMQHNPSQANAADLPKEVLEKIGSVAKVLMGEDSANVPKAEPHCNCIHCQIARAIHQGVEGSSPEEETEEEVSEDDLRFKTWDIEQAGDKLYTVSNPLDPTEQYTVYLGDPIGCTCGHKNCEHIKAVLNT